jgi:hypothetical protein
MARKCGKSARPGRAATAGVAAGVEMGFIGRFLKLKAHDDTNRGQQGVPALTVG